MYFKVRLPCKETTGSYTDVIIDIPRVSTILVVQKIIHKRYNIPVEHQHLYYRGKLLSSKITLIDCELQYNDVIQLVVKNDECDEQKKPVEQKPDLVESTNLFYQTGDLVEVCDHNYGAFWDARIIGIFSKSADPSDYVIRIHYEWNDSSVVEDYKIEEIRPRSHYVYTKRELKIGMIVLVNYNLEEPEKVGYWYDFEIQAVGPEVITGSLLIGLSKSPIKDISITLEKDIMRIEDTISPARRAKIQSNIEPKILPFYCDTCCDNGEYCCDCGCVKCGGKNDDASILLCDECGDGHHLQCLTPPLSEVPDDPEWYCPECKNPVQEIATFVPSSSNSRTSQSSSSGGMKNIGKLRACTIVPPTHLGPIPGVEVGTCWKFRFQIAEAGVHRPIFAPIHGSLKAGAYSLILTKNSDNHEDFGEEFTYINSGHTPSPKSKLFQGSNIILAKSCNAKMNKQRGVKAGNWKAGNPIRVVRSCQAQTYSPYAPKDGIRYDGIYKVVQYYPKVSGSGYITWHFQFKRDDPSPAPWSDEGEEYPITYPDGYLEAQASVDLREIHRSKPKRKAKSKIAKPKKNDTEDKKDSSLSESSKNKYKTFKEKFFGSKKSYALKTKPTFYLPTEVQRWISQDAVNSKVWAECVEHGNLLGKHEFLKKVKENFTCIYCHELLYKPITNLCGHTFCKSCYMLSLNAGNDNCPYCRKPLSWKRKIEVNVNAQKVLTYLFRGYEEYRKN